MSFDNDQQFEVGYGKPPVETRFRKGQSGNTQGRPKGSLNLATVLERTLNEKVVINENGRRRTITKREAAVKQLVNKAASGDLRALHQLTALVRAAEQKAEAVEAMTADNKPESALADTDAKVLQGIMKRFGGKSEEVIDVD
jgi:hypothetical protein